MSRIKYVFFDRTVAKNARSTEITSTTKRREIKINRTEYKRYLVEGRTSFLSKKKATGIRDDVRDCGHG
ncbi:hypothetical protein UWK_02382 [Desulfocapsa sulfexigens DSM 10523]|uniref:Uncharacterized protein n=1 Tax=Desulfocapsa sulfexigens (strain DSM 10523 / SB164P1) TaxID=1167006 RepID=M1PBA7_DESSD|nr:hypothetical protein UWK_02382 [Desulfocapsa sulfexigens DSM 10523]